MGGWLGGAGVEVVRPCWAGLGMAGPDAAAYGRAGCHWACNITKGAKTDRKTDRQTEIESRRGRDQRRDERWVVVVGERERERGFIQIKYTFQTV